MTIRARLDGRTALVTGAARRIGAQIARTLHAAGMNVCIHYRSSAREARALRDELLAARADSAELVQADLLDTAALDSLALRAQRRWGRLDALVNNASSFYPTPLASVSEAHWDDLFGTNLKAPFFLTRAAAQHLAEAKGCVVNIVDIHAERPLENHPVYCMAKAGLAMMTRSLARELGPAVRVNGVAPGAILWPERDLSGEDRDEIIARCALGRPGEPADIAETVLWLVAGSRYMTGQIVAVDGGRSLQQ